jgi:hypothetical protein
VKIHHPNSHKCTPNTPEHKNNEKRDLRPPTTHHLRVETRPEFGQCEGHHRTLSAGGEGVRSLIIIHIQHSLIFCGEHYHARATQRGSQAKVSHKTLCPAEEVRFSADAEEQATPQAPPSSRQNERAHSQSQRQQQRPSEAADAPPLRRKGASHSSL